MGSRQEHVREQIDRYLTGRLAPDDEWAFETHLLDCRPCRTEAEEASSVAIALARAPRDLAEDVTRLSDAISAARILIEDSGFERDRRLTVSVAPDGADTGVRAVAVGLRPGQEFDLVAVGADESGYVVARGVTTGASQTMAGTVPLPPHGIRFFALIQGRDDELLVATAG